MRPTSTILAETRGAMQHVHGARHVRDHRHCRTNLEDCSHRKLGGIVQGGVQRNRNDFLLFSEQDTLQRPGNSAEGAPAGRVTSRENSRSTR